MVPTFIGVSNIYRCFQHLEVFQHLFTICSAGYLLAGLAKCVLITRTYVVILYLGQCKLLLDSQYCNIQRNRFVIKGENSHYNMDVYEVKSSTVLKRESFMIEVKDHPSTSGNVWRNLLVLVWGAASMTQLQWAP